MQKLAAYQGQAHNASVIATFSHNGQRQNKTTLLYLLIICKLSWVLKEALKT